MPIPSGSGGYVGTGTAIKLVSDDGTKELWIRKPTPNAADNILCQTWDSGFPEPRVSKEERTGQSGDRDDTYLHGGSLFTASIRIMNTDLVSLWETMDELEYWLAPEKRHYVSIAKPDGSDEYRAVYRADPMALVVDRKSHTMVEGSLQLVLPDGVYLSAETMRYSLRPLGAGVGFSFPHSFPLSLTPSSGGSSASIVVGGTRPTTFKAYIYGGQTGPVITDTDTGLKISFTALGSLTIPLGSYVELDFEEGTALLNGDPNNSVYQYIDFGVSDWWMLRPGEINRIAATATASDASAETIIEFNNRRIRPHRG